MRPFRLLLSHAGTRTPQGKLAVSTWLDAIVALSSTESPLEDHSYRLQVASTLVSSSALLPKGQSESVSTSALDLLRRCRWKLTAAGTPTQKSELFAVFLEAYSEAARQQSFDIVQFRTQASSPGCDGVGGQIPSVLDESAKLLLSEAIESFCEAKIMKVPLHSAHYKPFLSSSALVHVDDALLQDLLSEFIERTDKLAQKNASTADNDAAEAPEIEKKKMITCTAAAYGAAGWHMRAATLPPSSSYLPDVVASVVASSRAGWRHAVEVACCISRLPPAASLTERMDRLCAKAAAVDMANRTTPSMSYFTAISSELSEIPVGARSLQSVVVQRNRVLNHLLRLCHPEAQWSEMLRLFTEARREKSLPNIEPDVPIGKMMHILGMANRWQESISLFTSTPVAMRSQHPSALNHLLIAVGQRAACRMSIDDASQGVNVTAAQEAKLLEELYCEQPVKNIHTHAAFVKAVTQCSNFPRGTLWERCLEALYLSRHDPNALRLVEDTLVHLALGGLWEAALKVVTTAQPHNRYRIFGTVTSRYADLLLVAAAAQQSQGRIACHHLQSMSRTCSEREVSLKQFALGMAILVAVGVVRPNQPAAAQAKECVQQVVEALRRNLIFCDDDYKSFAESFVGFYCSAVKHRSKAFAETGRSFDDVVRDGHGLAIGKDSVLANIMHALSVPPKELVSFAAARKLYEVPLDATAGSIKVCWEDALSFLSQVSGGDDASKRSFDTSSAATALLNCGAHQDVVLACF